MKFSVLMSIYFKEKPDYLIAALDSLLNQSLKADELVIVEDGILTKELYDILDQYQEKYPNLIKRVPLKENRGLGLALQEGILHCSNEIIARMDSDDIARTDRFDLQINEFKNNEKLDICSSHVLEFEGDISNIVASRTVPLTDEDIKKYQKRRDSFNHMAVMYKKSAVLKAGNYQSCLLMEDSLLWVNMILSGAVCANVDDFLVYARVGKDMFKRRGGLSYFKKYKMGRKQIYKTGYISYWDYIYTLIIQFIICIIPNKLREFIFVKLLHK